MVEYAWFNNKIIQKARLVYCRNYMFLSLSTAILKVAKILCFQIVNWLYQTSDHKTVYVPVLVLVSACKRFPYNVICWYVVTAAKLIMASVPKKTKSCPGFRNWRLVITRFSISIMIPIMQPNESTFNRKCYWDTVAVTEVLRILGCKEDSGTVNTNINTNDNTGNVSRSQKYQLKDDEAWEKPLKTWVRSQNNKGTSINITKNRIWWL